MKSSEKAEAITASVIDKHRKPDGEIYFFGAVCELANACALLTSTSKEERERGKQIVRELRHGTNFEK